MSNCEKDWLKDQEESQKKAVENYTPRGRKQFTKEELDAIIASEMAKVAKPQPETDRSCLERIIDNVWSVQQSTDKRSIYLDQDNMRVSFHFDGDGSLTSIEMED